MLGKRLLSVLLCLAMLVGILGGCGSAGTQARGESLTASAAEELVLANFRDIRDLNPHLYAGEMYAQAMLYDRLLTVTENGYAPSLAEGWDISEDGLVYTFHIREGVQFSDATACDAYAIEANFDAILENKERHTWLALIRLLVSAEATDKHTFVITMSEPYYPMLTELGVTRPFGMISPSAMLDGSTKDGVAGYIGTGPYVLTEFVTDAYAVFEANETYWGEQPRIRKITVRVIPDNQTRIMALQNGEIDLIYGKDMLDAEAMISYQDSDTFSVQLSDPMATRQIALNTTNEILSDTAVRQAIQYATNQQAISEGIFNGVEKPAETLYAKTLPYCDVALEPYTYDVDKAGEMLEGAGWTMGAGDIREKDGRALSLSLLYNSNSVTEKTISEYLQAEYKKIGIEITITGQEEQSYQDNLKAGSFDMAFNISWGTPYDPQSSLSAMRAPGHGDFAAQQGLAHKAALDQAIANILVSTDEAARQELYRYVLTELHESAMYLPITFECNKAVCRADLQGVGFNASSYEIPFESMFFGAGEAN